MSSQFDCDAKCDHDAKCHQCDCVWPKHTLEVNHSHHSLHPLKLFMGQLPDYSDGKCRLCGSEVDHRLFYHCSSCNLTLDMRCVYKPPPKSLLDLKARDHQLTLLPRHRNFTCNACGLTGDRSPYICVQCDFIIHQGCLGLPRVININRHDHRLSRTSVLGVVNSVCRVCHKKVDWTCGGYSCQRCPDYIVHRLYHITRDNGEICNGCKKKESHVLMCIEDDCEFALCFKCVTLPQVVKHRVDDHPLSLCFGGEKASGKYWCDICEKESDPRKLWFYTCKDHRASLHTKCVVGKYAGLMPGSTIKKWREPVEVVLNNSVTRPLCKKCESRCMYPIILKLLGTSDTYFCGLG